MSEPVSTQRVTIRPYQPADLGALYRVCLQTGRNGGDATPFYRDHELLGHVHAAPYALFEPSLAFVAEQLMVAVERGRVAAIAAGLQTDLIQRVEVGGLIGPDGDPLGAGWLGH